MYAIGPPLFEMASATASSAIPSAFYLMFISPQGKVKQADYGSLKKLFAADPELLERFKSDNYISDRIMAKYLIEFTEKYILDGKK